MLDFASILVHIFIPDERQYYNMERLWFDGDSMNVIQYSKIKDEEEASTNA